MIFCHIILYVLHFPNMEQGDVVQVAKGAVALWTAVLSHTSRVVSLLTCPPCIHVMKWIRLHPGLKQKKHHCHPTLGKGEGGRERGKKWNMSSLCRLKQCNAESWQLQQQRYHVARYGQLSDLYKPLYVPHTLHLLLCLVPCIYSVCIIA